ncbi:lysozyme family protein, partial [Streptococcus pyogenes]
YYHPLALISGGKLYKNGGNIYYSREVHFNLYLIELMSLF